MKQRIKAPIKSNKPNVSYQSDEVVAEVRNKKLTGSLSDDPETKPKVGLPKVGGLKKRLGIKNKKKGKDKKPKQYASRTCRGR